ncbi:decaprenyl-phosphate phosphoribosyltransferase [Bacillus sp. V3-13]|uniref:decaprenyl-phosphate phosphoribosyltransferase n=1 Tax=Bacillus sp. V3-13 TaxID=2053728 RepID=UPI000C78EB28|nr:decaprenyl-phosphate phosphoribosyltransferase [Bacillus sp. V3-13]PLR78262.1 decaprenyl-phosphate phosphoribosyltransferase [Bacillus sp. V3-13]
MNSYIASKEKSNNIVFLLLKQVRIKQWTKNLLVFAAILFSIEIATVEMVIRSLVGFLLFCFISGCVYILNDYADRHADREHPEKRHRPMASGALNPQVALFFGAFLFLISLFTAFYLNILFGIILIFYFIINVAYSFKLKHVVIVDIMVIAAGFVLRAIGGGVVIGVPFTPWFLLCTLLLALFLAISKRRHELYLLQNNMGAHRKVLEFYSPDLLNQFNSIVTTATIITYSLFTFTSGRTIHLMWTIPFVIYGIFRYLYLIHMEDKGGKPEKVLVEDRHILITVILYAITVVTVLIIFD